MQALSKFLHLLRQHEFEIMGFFSDNEYLRTAIIYSLRSGCILGVRLDEGVFDVQHITPDISHYITQSTDTTPLSTLELHRNFHSTFLSSLEQIKKEGECSANWKEWAYHFFDKGHLVYQPLDQETICVSPSSYSSSSFVTIMDFMPTYTGFIILLSLEQFIKAKTILHTIIPQLHSSLEGNLTRFTETRFQDMVETYNFIEKMKSYPFLSSTPSQLSSIHSRKQKLYTILHQVHLLIRSIQKELYNFEENSVEWTFQETMDFARRKRELYKHLDKLRLLCKHAEEMLWILHIHSTSTIIIYQVIRQKLVSTVDMVDTLIDFKGVSS